MMSKSRYPAVTARILSLLLMLHLVGSWTFPLALAVSSEDLLTELATAEGEARVAVLAALVDSLRTSDPQSAIDFGNEGLALIEQYGNPRQEVDILNEMSWAFRIVGNHPEALRHGQQGLRTARANDYVEGMARAQNNIGVVYFYLGDNDMALEHWIESLQLREQLDDPSGVAGSLNNIGLLYTRQGDFKNAISYLNRALNISRGEGNLEYQLNHLDNLGEAHAKLGEYSAAEQYYLQALSIADEANKLEGKTSVLINMGALHLQMGQLDRAEDYLNRGTSLAESLGGRSKKAEACFYLAKILAQRNEFETAIGTAQTALALAQELGEKHLVRDLHALLAELHEVTGAFAAALTHTRDYGALQEQLLDSERQNKLALLQTQFQAAESEREIELLRKDRAIQSLELENARTNERNSQIGIAAATVVSVGFFFAFWSRSRSRSRWATIADNYNQLLHSLPLGVMAINDAGTTRFANDALADITASQADALETLKARAQQMLVTNQPVSEWQLPLEGQPPRSLLLVVESRLDDTGKRSGLWLIAMDLTEQKATNAQLIQASKLATLGEMSTGMAHELNQPLNVISLAASNLRLSINKGKSTPDGLLTKIETIISAVGRAAHIIDHMRAYGRVADDGYSEVNVGQVVADACDLLRDQLKLKNISLINNVARSGLSIKGNAIQLEQVLLNVINNARDAILSSAGSGEILLSAEVREDHLRLQVRDSGGGIPADVLPHIFEPFFTTKPVGQGTGLGCSISYGIMRDMQGDMWAENVDGGAQITLSLPLAR